MPVIELDISVKNGVVVRAGEMLRIPAYVTGKPFPSLKWTKDDGALEKDRMEVEEAGHDSTLVIKCTKRSDHGKYQIQAANPSGIKSASTRVEVMGEDFSFMAGFLNCSFHKQV